MRSRMIWKTTVSLKQLRLQWENFEIFKWQHPVFCIGMRSPYWKTLNNVGMAPAARKSPELGKGKIQGGQKETSPIYEALGAYLLNQLSQNFRHCCFKICAWDCDDFKQCRAHGYGYSERISKFSNGNTHFFLGQINQRIEKPQMALERLTYDENCWRKTFAKKSL